MRKGSRSASSPVDEEVIGEPRPVSLAQRGGRPVLSYQAQIRWARHSAVNANSLAVDIDTSRVVRQGGRQME